MKHKIGFNRLDRPAAHRKALHRNMVGSLIKYERITTTKAKALEVRRSAEKMITRAKEDSVHNRRLVSRRLYDEGLVAKLFTDIAPRMKERAGGYTRILKLGPRHGDGAETVILEFVDYKLDLDSAAKKAARKDKNEANKTEAKAAKKGDAKNTENKKAGSKKSAGDKKTGAKAEVNNAATEKKSATEKKPAAAKKVATEKKTGAKAEAK